MMKFNAYNLVPSNTKRNLPPLRTTHELAAEFVVTSRQLSSTIAAHGGPKPNIGPRSGSYDTSVTTRAYYDPYKVRAWWRSLPQELKDRLKAKAPKLGKKGI